MKVEIFFEKETYSVKLPNGERYTFPINGRSKDEIIKEWEIDQFKKGWALMEQIQRRKK